MSYRPLTTCSTPGCRAPAIVDGYPTKRDVSAPCANCAAITADPASYEAASYRREAATLSYLHRIATAPSYPPNFC